MDEEESRTYFKRYGFSVVILESMIDYEDIDDPIKTSLKFV